ncbi:hypothetical protein HK100_003873 [Physocladia obscura]|uniref:ABC-type glycine betaine transport system substrate-binding domain-containing protein n=1 Tax=Physocladia obscura TaxID=109957 RepID=A0AAD5TCA6_9FUNG|nr:hypothetical protein HK100_003873 [Physocladia obscura]
MIISFLLVVYAELSNQKPTRLLELNRGAASEKLFSLSLLASLANNSAINPQGLNATEFASLTSDLLADNLQFSKCWNGSRYGWENAANYTGKKRTINLEQDDWDSAQVATNIFYRLASEVMGFSIRYSEYTGGYDNVLGPRLSAGITDVVMEMWTTGIPVVWFDHGSIGYSGRSGLYVPSWLADNYPTLAFDFWRFFQNPTAVKFFQTKEWDLGSFNSHVCDEPITNGCRNGTYKPAWWTPATASNFLTIWHIDPSWSQYHYERMIDGLGINATITWLGSEFYTFVDAALANGTAFIFYNWKPSSFVATHNVSRLMFPDSDNGMTQKWLLNPVYQPIQADEATTIITKVTPFDFGTDFPEIVSLLSLITIADNEMNQVLKNMVTNNWTYDVAVCDWMLNSEDEWKNWIPAPPTVINSCPRGEGLYESNGMSLCLTCPSGTYNWKSEISEACIACPEDATCPGGSVGNLI